MRLPASTRPITEMISEGSACVKGEIRMERYKLGSLYIEGEGITKKKEGDKYLDCQCIFMLWFRFVLVTFVYDEIVGALITFYIC